MTMKSSVNACVSTGVVPAAEHAMLAVVVYNKTHQLWPARFLEIMAKLRPRQGGNENCGFSPGMSLYKQAAIYLQKNCILEQFAWEILPS